MIMAEYEVITRAEFDALPDEPTPPIEVRRKRTSMEQALAPVRQASAAILDTIGTSPLAVEELGPVGYAIPNMVWGLGYIAGQAAEFAGLENEFGDKMGRYLQSGQEFTEQVTGAGPPQGVIENFFRSTGDLMVPMPANKVVKALSMVLPGAQSRSVGGVIAEAVGQGAIGEAAAEYLDSDYQGIAETMQKAFGEVPQPKTPEELILANTTPLKEQDAEQEKYRERAQYVSVATLAALGLGSAYTLAQATRSMMRSAPQSELVGTVEKLPPTEATQTLHPRTSDPGGVTPTKTVWEAQIFNRNAGVERAIEVEIAKDPLNWFRQHANDMWINYGTSMTMYRRINNFFVTGDLPNMKGGIGAKPIKQFYSDMSRLSKEQKLQLDDALIAGTRMDNMRQHQTNVWGSDETGWFTYKQLDDITKRMDPDTVVAFKEYNKIVKNMADWLAHGEDALLTPAMRKQFSLLAPTYAPLRTGIKRSVLQESLSNVDASITHHLTSRMEDINKGVLPGQAMAPTDMLIRYAEAMFKAKELNRLKRTTVDVLSDVKRRDGKDLITTNRPGAGGALDFTVYRFGKPTTYTVNDPVIASAMRFQPSSMGRIMSFMNMIRRAKQFATTGPLAPAFAPVSAGFEAVAGSILYKGSIGNRARILAGPVTGLARYAYGAGTEAIAHAAYRALNRDGSVIKNVLGETQLRAIHERMTDAYLDSTKRAYEAQGGGTALVNSFDPNSSLPSALLEIAPDYIRAHGTGFWDRVKSTTPVRAYLMALDAIHSSVRVEAFATERATLRTGSVDINGQRIPSIYIDERAAAVAHELTGNPAKSGGLPGSTGGKIATGITRSLPYSNIAAQALHRSYNGFKDAPVQTSAALITVSGAFLGSLAYQLSNNPTAANYYVNEMTSAQRSQGLPFFNADPGHHGPLSGMIQYPHELRMFISPVIEGVIQAYGLDSADGSVTGAMWDALKNVFMRDILPDPYPPAVAVATKAIFRAAGSDAQLPLRAPDGSRYITRRPRANRIDQNIDRGTFAFVEDIMQDLYGAAGSMIAESSKQIRTTVQHDITDNWVNILDHMTSGDARRIPGMVMSDAALQVRVSTSDPVSSQYHESYKNATELAKRMNELYAPGLGRKTPRPNIEIQGNVPPIDERTANIILGADMLLKDPGMVQVREMSDSIYINLDALETRAEINATTRRDRENDYKRQLRGWNSRGLEIVRDYEGRVAQVIGEEDFTFADPGL